MCPPNNHIARQPGQVYTVRQHWKSKRNPDFGDTPTAGRPASPVHRWNFYEQFSGSQAAGHTQRGGKKLLLRSQPVPLFAPVRHLVFRLPTPCTYAGWFAANSCSKPCSAT
jgi:hypothetical protein